MPSASAKIEKIAPSEGTDPVKSIVNMLEKRIRNLEKRKAKLDNYKMDVSNGKELNDDQKTAVSKYEQVEGLLEFTREFGKAMNSIVIESVRQQKKMAKKEQLERQQHEIQRLQVAFMYRHILSCFENPDVRNDFLNGENGAVKLTNDQLTQLDQLYKLIGPNLPHEQADISNHFHVLSENLIFLVEGKNKEIAGTTYKVLKDLLYMVKESGYFSRPTEVEEEVTSSDDAPEEDVNEEKVESYEETEESDVPVESKILVENDKPESQNSEEEIEVAELPPQIEPTGTINGPLHEVLSSQGSFNFLQESQIDIDAPHMDPAVVAVHQMAPPPVASFIVNNYPTSPPVETAQNIVNSPEICDVTVPPPIPTQVPIITNGIQRGPPVLTAVQHRPLHDFDPTHPIPTQTYTNQSFAVMQNMNMMMQPTYVPVTMHPHHPHIQSIAVMPGMTPPVTSAASVVPIHVSVAPMAISPKLVAAVEVGEGAVLKIEENNALQETPAEDETNELSENVPAETTNERTSNNEGYMPPFRGGYRGRNRGRGGGGYFRGRGYNNNRGGYQNHYYQDRNNYNGNFRRGNNRGGPRGGNINRGRGHNNNNSNFRTSTAPPQQQPTQQ